jgi:hypothetical protein
MLQVKECVPTPFPSIVFTFGFVVESIKEFGGVSKNVSLDDEIQHCCDYF